LLICLCFWLDELGFMVIVECMFDFGEFGKVGGDVLGVGRFIMGIWVWKCVGLGEL
jgi:hypothetical protein